MPVFALQAVHKYILRFPREKGNLLNYLYNDNERAPSGRQSTDQPFLIQPGRKFTSLTFWLTGMVILETLLLAYVTGNLRAGPVRANIYKAFLMASGTVVCVCYVLINLLLIRTL